MQRCGIDLIEVARVEAGIARLGERFLNRLFTPGERADCDDRPERLAARLTLVTPAIAFDRVPSSVSRFVLSS
jgi:phosphopantetheinyl transferase (holo-ACP synthase)